MYLLTHFILFRQSLMRIQHLLLVFTPVSSTNLLTTATAQKLSFIVKDKSHNSCVHLVTIAKRVTNVHKLFYHDKVFTKSHFRRNFKLSPKHLIPLPNIRSFHLFLTP